MVLMISETDFVMQNI